jgi:hypothetical protein
MNGEARRPGDEDGRQEERAASLRAFLWAGLAILLIVLAVALALFPIVGFLAGMLWFYFRELIFYGALPAGLAVWLIAFVAGLAWRRETGAIGAAAARAAWLGAAGMLVVCIAAPWIGSGPKMTGLWLKMKLRADVPAIRDWLLTADFPRGENGSIEYGDVPEDKWPACIRSLGPEHVTVSPDGRSVRIWWATMLTTAGLRVDVAGGESGAAWRSMRVADGAYVYSISP